MSLLYTMQNLDRSLFRPVLALTNNSEAVIGFYRKAGLEPIICPGIMRWFHSAVSPRPVCQFSSWTHMCEVILKWKITQRKTMELVEQVNPDIVHLNSMALAISAKALAQKAVPFVWHVREPPPASLLGIRTAMIRNLMLHCPKELIFISKADRRAWVGESHGQVVYNFVNFRQFDRTMTGDDWRRRLNILADIPVILYLGGLRKVKGVFPLLRALAALKKRLPRFRCLMPGSEYNPPDYWQLNFARAVLPWLGSGTVGQRVEKDIACLGLGEVCVRFPFVDNIAPLMAASDVVVFPATQPHFARPVIEAGAMAKPVVVSRFNVIEELVQDGKSGLLVEPNAPESLADALHALLTNKKKSEEMGEAGYAYARQKFSATQNCARIMEIYDRILQDR